MKGIALALTVSAVLLVTSIRRAHAISWSFDENGNSTFVDNVGNVYHPVGTLLANQSNNGGGRALTYVFPAGITVVAGDVAVLDESGQYNSDGLRFTNVLGLPGFVADRMIFYSSDSSGDLADTGLPSNFNPGSSVQETGDSFKFVAGANTYIGLSDDAPPATPEPGSIAMLVAGAMSGGMLLRKRCALD